MHKPQSISKKRSSRFVILSAAKDDTPWPAMLYTIKYCQPSEEKQVDVAEWQPRLPLCHINLLKLKKDTQCYATAH